MTQMRCRRKFKRGWYCRRTPHVTGPCALVPRWWNVRAYWYWLKVNGII